MDLWFAQQLVDTLKREVAEKEAELAVLLNHKTRLLRAFSTPTFPPVGYGRLGAIPDAHAEPPTRDPDKLENRTISRTDVSGRPYKGKVTSNPIDMVEQNPLPHKGLSLSDHDSPAEQDTPPRASSPVIEQFIPDEEIGREPETSDDSDNTAPASDGRDGNHQSRRGTALGDTAPRSASLRSSDLEGSSKSSEDKAPLSRVFKPARNQLNCPAVNWTEQMRKRSSPSLNGDSSSDTDTISSEDNAGKDIPVSLEPTTSGKKVSLASRPAKAATQAPTLPSDAPPEDLFDWEVLSLSGTWSQEKTAGLLSQSSWSHLQKRQTLLPHKFDTMGEYKSSFKGLIIEECKAHLESSWEAQKISEVGTNHNSIEPPDAPEENGQPKMWQFRPMHPSDTDPFKYVEAEILEGPAIRLDPSEIVLLTCNGTKVLAIVTLTHYKGVLLRTRIELQAAGGQCTLLRLANMVTLRRQYISLCNALEIWDPLQQQLLDPLRDSKFVICPPADCCFEEDVKLSSCINPLLAWKDRRIFNNKQLVAMEALLLLKQGFLLVQGRLIKSAHPCLQALQEQGRARILVCASSNAAVDEIVFRLMNLMIDKAGKSFAPERGALVRLGVEKSIHSACLPVSLDNILQGNAMASKSTNARREILAGASIVCCTISGSGHQAFDEALESEVLIALQRVRGRCVMVGDPCQLPAVVLQRPGTAYGRSLFERMQEAGRPVFMLTTQYRMHPQISQFPSSQFYGGLLQDSSEVQAMLPIFTKEACGIAFDKFKLGSYTFLDVTWGMEQGEVVGHSLSNLDEAEVVANVVQRVVRSLRKGLQPNIGVITPYLAQRSAITNYLAERHVDESAYEVNTVDGFQGREKDIIVLSCVRAQTEYGLGFVSDVRRMNVALTRARHSLIIVGHAVTLRRQSSTWSALLENASSRNLYQVLFHKPKMTKVETRQEDADFRKANAATGSGQHSKHMRVDRGSKLGTGTTQDSTPRRLQGGGASTSAGTRQQFKAPIGTGQRFNHTRFQQGANEATVQGSNHIRFDDAVASSVRPVEWTRFQPGVNEATVQGSNHIGFDDDVALSVRPVEWTGVAKQGQGEMSNKRGGVKRKVTQYENGDKERQGPIEKRKRFKEVRETNVGARTQQQQWRSTEDECKEDDHFRMGGSTIPAVGKMRGQVDHNRSGWGWHDPNALWGSTAKEGGGTMDGFQRHGHGHAGKQNSWQVGSRPDLGGGGGTMMGATPRNCGGGASRGSGKSAFNRNKMDFCERVQTPMIDRREERQVSRHGNSPGRQSFKGRKRGKGKQYNSFKQKERY